MKKLLNTFIFALPIVFSAMPAGAFELPKIDKAHTAVLVTDPQNDFLSKDGKIYPLIEENLKELGTIENIEKLMQTAKKKNITLAVDPLEYSDLDSNWSNSGALQKQLLDMGALQGKGAEFYGPYKNYIFDGKTIISAPHKMYGPESNDLIYQLRNRNIDTVILGGMVANLCVDSHMRALMENGFKVYVVKDAVAAPGQEAYQAALVNYSMIANGMLTTSQAIKVMSH